MSWLAREASPRTAAVWAARIGDAVAALRDFPEIGAPVDDVPFSGLRERLVGPYRLIYRFDGVDCWIVTMIRAEQDLRGGLDPEDLS
jgi:plasmid stabilization system protein ParE